MKMKVLSDGPPRGHSRITSWVLVFIRKSDVEKDNTVHSQDVVKKKVREMKQKRMDLCSENWESKIASEAFTDYKILEIESFLQ